MTTPEVRGQHEHVGLKRELGLFSAISIIVAVMIGSGIFVSPTSALDRSGSIGLCLIIWTLCGFVSLLGALAFAELSTIVPRSGAEYSYFVEAFTPLHPYFGQLPAFICAWVFVFVLRPAEVAVITLTFAEYLVQPFAPYFNHLDAASWSQVKKLIAAVALGVIVYINMTSVKLYVKVQNVFMVFKIGACVLVVFGGIWWMATGHTELLNEPFKETTTSPGQIALAFYNGLWAYDGWTAAALIAEEVQHPEVNILRSILVAVPIVTILYVSMNLVYMSALTKDEMINAPAVVVAWAEKVLPAWMGFVIPLGVALSTFGCGLSVQFGVARLCYAAGRQGHVPRFFSCVHFERMTPAPAVALQGFLTLIYIYLGSKIDLIEFCSFLIWIFYGMAMVALIILPKSNSVGLPCNGLRRIVPWIVLLISAFLVILSVFGEPSQNYAFVLIFVLLGCIVNRFYVYKRRKSKFMRKITYLVQMLFMVVAPDEAESEKNKTDDKKLIEEIK